MCLCQVGTRSLAETVEEPRGMWRMAEGNVEKVLGQMKYDDSRGTHPG